MTVPVRVRSKSTLSARAGDAPTCSRFGWPIWDFPTPDFILDALRDRLAHPILGYTAEPADYRPAIVDWMAAHHDWRIAPEWISFVPGVVKGIAFVLDAFTQPGDKILIQPPVYHLFR